MSIEKNFDIPEGDRGRVYSPQYKADIWYNEIKENQGVCNENRRTEDQISKRL